MDWKKQSDLCIAANWSCDEILVWISADWWCWLENCAVHVTIILIIIILVDAKLHIFFQAAGHNKHTPKMRVYWMESKR